MEGFRHVDYLLAHGTGDDNVHFLNTAALLDRLTVAHVRSVHLSPFPQRVGTNFCVALRLQWLPVQIVYRFGSFDEQERRVLGAHAHIVGIFVREMGNCWTEETKDGHS